MKNFYWRCGWFESLRSTAGSIPDGASWQGYRDYCLLLEKGLRRPALEALEGFVRSLAHESFAERAAFNGWLVPRALESPNLEQLIPFSLMKEVIRPTLDEWLAAAPEEARLHYWRGQLARSFSDLQEALRLDPGHVETRAQIIGVLLNGVDYMTHHLPANFIGDPELALADMDEAESLLHESLGSERLAQLRQEIAEYRSLTLAYLEMRRPRV